MHCPNCTTTFILRADYAEHLQHCRPADVDVTDALVARLNAAAARLHAEFGDLPPSRRARRLVSAA